jgi:hypothetical protein
VEKKRRSGRYFINKKHRFIGLTKSDITPKDFHLLISESSCYLIHEACINDFLRDSIMSEDE